MKTKTIFLVLFLVLLIYPGYVLYELEQVNSDFANLEVFKSTLTHFQISIWVPWVFMVGMAIYYKWTLEKNLFFYLIYLFLLITNIFFGYYFQEMVTNYRLQTTFEDEYTLGVLEGIKNFGVAAVLTVFLQAAVWWFTRRWHRR